MPSPSGKPECDFLPPDAQNLEVLNFGISGHGTAQQLQMLRHYAGRFEPDVVLLAFFAGNDIRNNSRRLEPDPVRPFFQLEAGQLVLDDSFLEHPDFLKANSPAVARKVACINASRLLQLANEWKNRPPRRVFPKSVCKRSRDCSGAANQRLYT